MSAVDGPGSGRAPGGGGDPDGGGDSSGGGDRPGFGPRDFRLLTPANWYVLDLAPATRAASIARLVEERFGRTDDPRLVQAKRELTALLRGAARDAERNGAIYAALMDTLVAGVALSASLIAVVGAAPADEHGNPVTDPAALSALLLAGELAAALDAATAPAGGTGRAGPTPSTVDLSDVDGDTASGGGAGRPGDTEIVELPAGPAVRLRRRADSGLAGTAGGTAPAAEIQYFLSVPDTDRMLALTFATPNVDLAAQFEELFDTIAGTLEWQWEPA